MKNPIKKGTGTMRWQAARLQPVHKNRGIKKIEKQKQQVRK